MLRLNNLEVVYNDIILVLRGISLEVPDGSIVAFLGSNGAGKSTTLRAISGLMDYEDGEIKKGTIEFTLLIINAAIAPQPASNQVE